MTYAISPSVQSPRAYDLANLQGQQVANRLTNAMLRGRLTDAGYAYVISPADTASGLVAGDLTLGYLPGDLRRYGGDPTGATDAATALTRAYTQAQQTGGASVAVAAGTYLIDTDVTVPADVVLDFTKGGKFSIAAGNTLTISGRVIAAPGQQIFTGSGLVVFSIASQQCVWPNWWGTASGTINKARASVLSKYIPVYLVPGTTYQFSTKLSITDQGAQIIGPGSDNDTAGGVYTGATLEFTGTGIAIEVGVAPDTNADFLYKLCLEGFMLKVPEDTTIALRCWHLAGRWVIRCVTVRGSSDKNVDGNVGMKFEGCIDGSLERCMIFGQGTTATLGPDPEAITQAYLDKGYWFMNGYNNSVTTTIVMRRCYATQCRFGRLIDSDSTVCISGGVSESCRDAGLLVINAKVECNDFWMEDNGKNGNAALRIQGADACVSWRGGRISIGTNQTFISCENTNKVSLLGGTQFGSAHANPIIVDTGGNACEIDAIGGGNTYPANYTLLDTATATANKKAISWRGGQLVIGGLEPHASAVLDCQSTTKGLALPRMTSTERDAISSPTRILIFNMTTNKVEVYDGTSWVALH